MSQNYAIAVIGIDIGKNSFHVVRHERGAIVLRQNWSRGQVEGAACQSAGVPDAHRSLSVYIPQSTDIIRPAQLVRLVPKDTCAATKAERFRKIDCQECSSSSSAFASFKLSVSKPSLNQP
jgi:hypothetical protein